MNLSNPYWHCTGRGNRLLIRCLHPRPTTQLIRHLTLTWDDGTSRRAEGLGCRSGAGSDYEIDAGSTSPSSMQAELDLRHEYESLRQLRPQAGVIDQWLEGLRRNKKRWRGLVLAANSGDPTLTVTKHYNKRFTPLLCKLAILFGVNDPGLAVVMGFSPRGRQLHAWLMLIQPATPLHLPLLQLNPQGELGHEVRLLALSRMIKQADRHNPFAPAAPLGTVPLLQYWEGSPILRTLKCSSKTGKRPSVKRRYSGWMQLALLIGSRRIANTKILSVFSAAGTQPCNLISCEYFS
jgi:hypothetical protein